MSCSGGDDLIPTQPIREPYERQRDGRGEVYEEERRALPRNFLNPLVSNSPPRGLLI
jgi:hypothetical protein